MSVHTQNLLTLDDTTSAAQASRDAERSALVREALRLAGRIRLRVRGESMLPSLWPSEVAEIERCSAQDVRAGDIVLAERDGRLFLHRLIEACTAEGFTLRGDSLPNPDPPFETRAMLGRLVSHQGNVFVLKPVLSRAIGLFFCYFALLRRLGLKLHVRRRSRVGELQKAEVLK